MKPRGPKLPNPSPKAYSRAEVFLQENLSEQQATPNKKTRLVSPPKGLGGLHRFGATSESYPTAYEFAGVQALVVL